MRDDHADIFLATEIDTMEIALPVCVAQDDETYPLDSDDTGK